MFGIIGRGNPSDYLFMTKKISEARIRAFNRCTEFHHRGGLIELPIKTQIVEYVYIKLILDIMRQPYFDFKISLNQHLKHAERFLKLKESFTPAEASELVRHSAVMLNEIFRILKPNAYVPAFGAFEYPIKVSESILNLNVSALLTTNIRNTKDNDKQIMHAVTFSPYTATRDMENDIVQNIKARTIAQALPVPGHRTFLLHIFGPGSGIHLSYTNIECTTKPSKDWAQYLEQPIKLLESGYHFPVAPCNYPCVFKAECKLNPGVINV